MSTLLDVNWTDVVAVLGALAVVAMLLLLTVYVQLWRHRIHRIRREARGSGQLMRDVQPRPSSEDRIDEYLKNADFTNEGNPNLGWKDRFLERSVI